VKKSRRNNSALAVCFFSTGSHLIVIADIQRGDNDLLLAIGAAVNLAPGAQEAIAADFSEGFTGIGLRAIFASDCFHDREIPEIASFDFGAIISSSCNLLQLWEQTRDNDPLI